LINALRLGEIWTRTGLCPQIRSMLTLAMMVALNRPNEFRMHVRAALTNGVPPRRNPGSPAPDRHL